MKRRLLLESVIVGTSIAGENRTNCASTERIASYHKLLHRDLSFSAHFFKNGRTHSVSRIFLTHICFNYNSLFIHLTINSKPYAFEADEEFDVCLGNLGESHELCLPKEGMIFLKLLCTVLLYPLHAQNMLCGKYAL